MFMMWVVMNMFWICFSITFVLFKFYVKDIQPFSSPTDGRRGLFFSELVFVILSLSARVLLFSFLPEEELLLAVLLEPPPLHFPIFGYFLDITTFLDPASCYYVKYINLNFCMIFLGILLNSLNFGTFRVFNCCSG